jgi:hypothetical protein
MKIKYLKITADIDITGVVNYNGQTTRSRICQKTKEDESYQYLEAKKNRNGLDFTSSNCLRHHLFLDIQPRQPANAERATYWVAAAASEVGIIRGMMDPAARVGRTSPLAVSPAYTKSDASLLFEETLTSSKPKEGKAKNAEGKVKGDTSLFHRDGAPPRQQAFEAILKIKELQFINLSPGMTPLVAGSQEAEFKDALEANFQFEKTKIADYCSAGAVIKTPMRGILFDDGQLKKLALKVLRRIENLEIHSTKGSMAVDRASIKIKLCGENGETVSLALDDFIRHIEQLEFQKFYIPA